MSITLPCGISLGKRFSRFQQMLASNYAAYDRYKSRGAPRDVAWPDGKYC